MDILARATKSYIDPYANDIHVLHEEFGEKRRQLELRDTFVPATQWRPSASASSSNRRNLCAGDLRLRRLRELLNTFKRTPDQIKMHEEDFIPLTLPLIYGDDFEANRLRLMKEFKLTSFKVGALALLPRRWGKTVGVSQFVACLLFIGVRITVATFSQGQRASTSLMGTGIRYLYQLKGGAQRIVAKNEEEFKVATLDQVQENGSLKYSKATIRESGAVNTLLAFPASSNGILFVLFLLALTRQEKGTQKEVLTLVSFLVFILFFLSPLPLFLNFPYVVFGFAVHFHGPRLPPTLGHANEQEK